MQDASDIVVFDEELASYISSTDYTGRTSICQDVSGHQARLSPEHEAAALAAADSQYRLQAAMRDLETEVMLQDGDLQVARDLEARACIERDNAQDVIRQLQHQVCVIHGHLPTGFPACGRGASAVCFAFHRLCCTRSMKIIRTTTHM